MAETKSHASSRSKAVLGGKGKSKSKGGKKPHHIEIHRGKSGGFIVKHHHLADDGAAPEEPDQHIVPDMDSLQSHVADNMGDQPPMPAPAASAAVPAGPAPAPAGPAPAPGM